MEELKIEGEFGNVFFSTNTSSRFITIDTGVSNMLFRGISVTYPNIVANNLGLYSFAEVGNNGMARFSHFTTPKHLLSRRKSGCIWRPKGKMTMNSEELTLCPVEFMGEQCPDAFYYKCLESIFGPGNEIRDITSTPAGQKVFQEFLSKIYVGLGNSFYELAEFGQHKLIADSNTNGWYKVDEDEWDDYTDQQSACAGHITLVDELAESGDYPALEVQIRETDTDGKNYIGDAIALIDSIISAQSDDMSLLVEQNIVMSTNEPIIRVSSGIFERFRDQVMLKYNCIPGMMEYWMNNTVKVGDKRLLGNVLRYKGYVIVKYSAWGLFDKITGTVTHRALLGAPGVFGLAHDVSDLRQFSGMGLRVNQHLEAPYMGKIFLDTAFKMGAAILDPNYLAGGSLTLVPG